MSRIYKSSQLTSLAGKLAQMVEENTGSDLLRPQTIIVPNLDTARWLKLYLAEKNGISANIDFLLPSEWQYRQIRMLYPDLPKMLPSDILPMSWSVFGILSSDQISNFPKLHSYIRKQEKERAETAAWQLAKQISSVFDQYIVYRPELIKSWQNGRTGEGDEKWQSDLWRKLNREWKLFEDPALRKNRVEILSDLIAAAESGNIVSDDPLFVFNPGLIPLSILEVLNTFSKKQDVFMFCIQPAVDELQDVENLKNPLLKSLGQEAVNIHKTVSKTCTIESEYLHSDEIKGSGNLRLIRLSIIENSELTTTSIPDNSIQIHSCHSPLREIEVLHQFLLESFEQDEHLHPDDVLVVTPDPEMYAPYIKAVFGVREEGLPEIPWHQGGSRSADYSIERAFRQLLSLFDSRFTFSGVMDLFLMKPVFEAFDVSETDAAMVKHWMEENHVVWGLNGGHRAEWDQPAEENQTWQSALKRGWLGQWIGDEPGRFAENTLLYNGIQSVSQKEVWASFSKFLNLLDVFRKESKQKKSVEQWHGWIDRILKQFFKDPGKSNSAFFSLTKSLDKIHESAAVVNSSDAVPFSLIRAEILSSLDQTSSASAMFTRGVTFSSMVPVRSIPFKVIALIGLNETSFPRKQNAPDFDLISRHPEESDRNRKFEDRNLFLESVLAAENIHYCSYIGQSPVDNEPIPPSPVVSEWVDYLAKIFDCKRNQIIKKATLNSFSLSNFESGKSYSKLNFETARFLADENQAISGIDIGHSLPQLESPGQILIDDLSRFFSSPIRWFLKNRFDTSLREPESGKDEFMINNLEKHLHFQRVFGWMLSGTSCDEMKMYLMESGALPAGWAGERILSELISGVKFAIDAVKEKEIDLEIFRNDVSIYLNDSRIEGIISSYSKSFLLDINPSKFSGSIAIQSWIRHLCWIASEAAGDGKSLLLCELKKGKPVWVYYNPVDNAAEILEELLQFFCIGRDEPVTFFPKTVFAYEEAGRSVKKSDPMEKAASEFEGGFNGFGEREDLSVSVLMGNGVPFRDEFVSDQYRKIVQTMMDHMEVTK